jgi:hypothetical protein
MYTQETVGTRTINVFHSQQARARTTAARQQKLEEVSHRSNRGHRARRQHHRRRHPGYLRDAIDEGGGRPRLKPELVDLALRDANTLVSMVADIPPGMSQHCAAMGAPPNAEMERMVDAVRQVQVAVNMQPSTFGVQSIIRMDDAEKASALSGLINIGTSASQGRDREGFAEGVQLGQGDQATALRVIETLHQRRAGHRGRVGPQLQQARVGGSDQAANVAQSQKQETARAPSPARRRARAGETPPRTPAARGR